MMYWPWNAVIAIGVVFLIDCGVLFAGWQLGKIREREAQQRARHDRQFVADVERFLQDR